MKMDQQQQQRNQQQQQINMAMVKEVIADQILEIALLKKIVQALTEENRKLKESKAENNDRLSEEKLNPK